MSQYTEDRPLPSSDYYSTLNNYYSSPPAGSLLTYIPYPSETPYLDSSRQTNIKLQSVKPVSYNTLINGGNQFYVKKG